MSDTTISPNMGLIVPTVGQDPGPDWANNLNADLGVLDQHNHAPGSGVQINPNGININADLSMHNNNLTQVNTVNFQAHLTALPGLFPNLGAIYVAGNELYYNDEIGNVVQITNTGSVNAGAGSITGLPSGTAGVTYNSGDQTFIFQSATSTPANIDGGSFIFRDIVANSKGVTVSAPNSLASDYQIFLPSALPGSISFLTLDTSGNIAAAPTLLGGLTTSNLSPTAGILGTQIANQTLTQNLMAPMTTGSTVGIGGVAVSASCGAFATSSTSPVNVTNLSVTITTTGRPVCVYLQADGGAAVLPNPPAQFGAITTGLVLDNFSVIASAIILNGSTPIYANQLQVVASNSNSPGLQQGGIIVPADFYSLDLSVNGVPGTYTYTVQLQAGNGITTATLVNSMLVAYEI